MLENGLEKCTCPKTKCKRHGNCVECFKRHTKSLPRCKRVNKSAPISTESNMRKGNSNSDKKTKHIPLIIVCAALSVSAVLVVIYAMFGFNIFKSEDLDFIEAVNSRAISANVLFIEATETAGESSVSTSYSAGHSGVVFKKENGRYYVLTALHAIGLENTRILVLRYDQQTFNEYVAEYGYEGSPGFTGYYAQFPEAVIEHYDEAYDLAILSFISELDFTVLAVASEAPKHNDSVAAIGNPHNSDRNTVTTGRITSRNPVPFGDEAGKSQNNVVKHSAETSMGSSGGALLNKDMEIVGINLGGSENIFRRFVSGNAMPSDRIIDFLEEWTAKNETD